MHAFWLLFEYVCNFERGRDVQTVRGEDLVIMSIKRKVIRQCTDLHLPLVGPPSDEQGADSGEDRRTLTMVWLGLATVAQS